MKGTHYRIELSIRLVTNSELPCKTYRIHNLEVAMANARTLKRIIESQFEGIKVKLWKVEEIGESNDLTEINIY